MGVEVRLNTTKLSALARDLSPGMISALLRRAGFEAEGEAKRLAPVDTGFLRGSLSTKATGPQEVTVGASASYAPFVEFGTRFSRAQPFLHPAAQKAVNNLVKALEAMLRRAQ